MTRLLLHSVSVSAIAVFATLLFPPYRLSIIGVTAGLAIGGNTYGSEQHSNDNPLLFNPYNQYTVDQLLIKMPSVLEEPELADSEISTRILEPPTKNDNQNIFKLHLKSLLDSLSFNDSKSSTNQSDTDAPTNSESLTTFLPDDSLGETTTESLFENLNDFQSKFDSSLASRKSLPLELVPKSEKINPEESRKRQQEANLMAQSRYRSVKHILSQIHFNCTGREEGYYADPDFDCHIFHYCKENGFKFTFICPANSVFSQEELQCDSSPVNSRNLCRSSEDFYFINSLIYKHNTTKALANFGENFEKISNVLQKSFKKLKTFPEQFPISFNDGPIMADKNEKIASESAPKLHLSGSSKWNGIDLTGSSPKKVFKDSVIYTPKGDLPGFRPLFGTTQAPIVQQIDTPRWFPPVNATSDILNKFNKNGFNVYNSQRQPQQQPSGTSVTSPATPTTTNVTSQIAIESDVKKENKYSQIAGKIVEKRPFLKVKGKPPKRLKIPTGNTSNSSKQKTFHAKIKPAYSIQWDDDSDVPINNHRQTQSELDIDERSPASSNMQQITIRPSMGGGNVGPSDNDYLYSRKSKDPNFNPLLMESPDFSAIEFDEIFNKIPLRPLQAPIVPGSPDQAYQHMFDHLRQRPPPRVLAALARDQLKPLRMMINNFLVTGTGNSIAKRQFLITPPQTRPFVPESSSLRADSGERNKLVKRSDRYLFGPPIIQERYTRRRLVAKLKKLWRPIARRLNL